MSNTDDARVEQGGDTPRLGFDCPNCGDTTVFDEGSSPEEIKNSIYECGGCGENILMNDYVGEQDE